MNFKVIISAAMLCVFLAACQNSPQKTESVSNETTAPTETAEPTTSPVPSEFVVTGQEKTFADSDGKNETVFKIPKLNFDTADAKAINSAINERYGAAFEAEQGKSEYSSINYNAYLNDDIISLLITAEKKGHAIDYGVYNYNKTTGEKLDNSGLLDYLKLSGSDVYEELKEALQDDYTSKFKYEDFPDDYYYQLEMTVGDEAIAQSQMFLNGDAELYAACTERASVGAGEFEVLIAINP